MLSSNCSSLVYRILRCLEQAMSPGHLEAKKLEAMSPGHLKIQ